MNGRRGEEGLAVLIERRAELKRDLVDFACSPRLERAEHGEALMRRRKAWYYRREPRPGVTVIGDRLLELAFGGRG
ncbi:MAG TPA: hypothetical protein VKG61_20860 [Streptosporangiaceae bacterium]|nr:hypothetical protein [Streptosporangiaceae bacterium]